MSSSTQNSRLLAAASWIMAALTLAFMAADVTLKVPSIWLRLMPAYCLAAFALLHSTHFLGLVRAIWFVVLAVIVAYIAESLGMSFNAIFGAHWYRPLFDLAIPIGVILPGSVPLAVILNWYGILYLSFVASIFLLKANREDISSFATVPLCAALLTALWQIAAGPANVGRAMLTFVQEGFYHSIPLSHFIGWYVTSMFIVLFFQAVEPNSVNADRFNEVDQRTVAPLAAFVYGASVLYPTAVCFRLGFSSAGWLGVAILSLFVLGVTARARTGLQEKGLAAQPTGA